MRRLPPAAAVALAVLTTTGLQIRAHADPPRPRGYVALRLSAPALPVNVDGRLDDPAWASAPWTDLFVDIEGDAKPKPTLNTRVKMLWDDRYFYIGAQMDEPHLRSELTAHDAVIFHENDFEVFIDPDADSHAYYEFEINTRGTFWDLLLPVPYRAGGQALNSWEIPGLKSAVHLDGTLNNPADTDRGWSVELAMPWAVLGEQAHRPSPPTDGDQWRINFSRVEWPLDTAGGRYRPRPGVNEHNWVWSPQHVVDMHRPERWGYVQFSSSIGSSGSPGVPPFVPDVSWPARQWLQSVYEAQREYRQSHRRYAATFEELGVAAPSDALLRAPVLVVTPSLFEATIELHVAGSPAAVWHIRQDARVWRE